MACETEYWVSASPGSAIVMLDSRGLLSTLGCALTLVAAACDEGGPQPLEAPVLSATPELRIGSLDDASTALTYIRAMQVDREGRIYTAHPQDVTILVHDADGNRVGRWGRKGEGPGEFDRLGGIGFVGDTLWAFDYGLYRITYFRPDGSVLRSVKVPIDLGEDPTDSPPRPSGVLPDGRLFGSPPAWSHEVARGTITETPVLVMDTTGAAGDTLFRRPASVWAVQAPTGPITFGSYRPQPFDDNALHAMSPHEPEYVVVDRAVEGEDDTRFGVARITFDGDTAFDRSFAYEPVPIDPGAADSLVGAFAEAFNEPRFSSAPTAAQAAEWARANLYVPAHQPPVTALLVGRDGSIWLQRERAAPERVEWLVLDPDGEPIGRVELPGRTTVAVAERSRVWGWELDDLDVPYIVRYGVGATSYGVNPTQDRE